MLLKIKYFIKQISIIFFATLFLILMIDFFFGNLILQKLDKLLLKTEFYGRLISIKHPIYHHDLKSNVKYVLARGFYNQHMICTDNHGFKSKCDQIRGKKYKYAFLGDSFTEGISLNYEDTYAGLFENFSKKQLANLGVVSYSPKIYLSKINYLIKNSYHFEHVVIFIDISDLFDDNVMYDINDDFIVTNKKKGDKLSKKIINYYKENTPFNRDNFPLTNFSMFVLKQINFSKKNQIKFQKINQKYSFHKKANLKAQWTYSSDFIKGYNGSIKKAQEEMVGTMNKLYEILKKNNIKMSVVIYPWPHQLIHDSRNSKHVKMWSDFCKNKCTNFINTFDIFFDEIEKTSLEEVVKKYYFSNDPHFNKMGNKLIFNQLIKYLN